MTHNLSLDFFFSLIQTILHFIFFSLFENHSTIKTYFNINTSVI